MVTYPQSRSTINTPGSARVSFLSPCIERSVWLPEHFSSYTSSPTSPFSEPFPNPGFGSYAHPFTFTEVTLLYDGLFSLSPHETFSLRILTLVFPLRLLITRTSNTLSAFRRGQASTSTASSWSQGQDAPQLQCLHPLN